MVIAGITTIPKEPPSSASSTTYLTPNNQIFTAVVADFSIPTTTTTVPALPADYAAWTRVAVCEEGGWIGASGPAYPNSLGITAANWYAYGGGSDYSPAAQIAVADRLIADTGMSIPDQNGCAAW